MSLHGKEDGTIGQEGRGNADSGHSHHQMEEGVFSALAGKAINSMLTSYVKQSLSTLGDSSERKDAAVRIESSPLLPKTLSLPWSTPLARQPDICSIFPTVAQAQTPQEKALDQMMEEEIKCQAQKEAASVARVQALRKKYSDAA